MRSLPSNLRTTKKDTKDGKKEKMKGQASPGHRDETRECNTWKITDRTLRLKGRAERYQGAQTPGAYHALTRRHEKTKDVERYVLKPQASRKGREISRRATPRKVSPRSTKTR